MEFHRTAFVYALDNFPLDDDFLKHAQFLNFLDRKCTFDSVLFVAEKLKKHVQFTPQQFAELEQEFLLLQSTTLEDMPQHALDKAVIWVDPESNDKVYRIDVLWYHLFKMNIPGTTRSKFRTLFELANVVLCIIHSNAEEESVFSRVCKNLTPQHASLEIEGTLSSIISFQLNSPQGESCHQYKPSSQVIARSKKVTWEYNKEHSSKHRELETAGNQSI